MDNERIKQYAESSFDTLTQERELAEYATKQVVYAGIFLNPDDVYGKFPPQLAHKIRDPHITTAYRPSAEKILLDALGSGAKIIAVGYGNDGNNEGLLAEVITEDPALQKVLDEREEMTDDAGEVKPVPIHITLSISEAAKAVNTRNLNFQPLDTPVELTGIYKLFAKDGTLISDRETIQKMQQSGRSLNEVKDPDRPSN